MNIFLLEALPVNHLDIFTGAGATLFGCDGKCYRFFNEFSRILTAVMNIQFHRDLEVPALEEYDIFLNGRQLGRIRHWGEQWAVSITLPTKSWSAHMHPTLEAAQEFVRKTLEENA